MILVFWMLSFKPTFSLFSFTFIKRLFSSSSFSAIGWCHLCIWGYWYFSWQSWFQLVLHPTQHFWQVCFQIFPLYNSCWIRACPNDFILPRLPLHFAVPAAVASEGIKGEHRRKEILAFSKMFSPGWFCISSIKDIVYASWHWENMRAFWW